MPVIEDPATVEKATRTEERFAARLKACRMADKLNYRLGEVEIITGFNREALLKMKEAGSLKPWRPAGYGWDCYPREQVKALLR